MFAYLPYHHRRKRLGVCLRLSLPWPNESSSKNGATHETGFRAMQRSVERALFSKSQRGEKKRMCLCSIIAAMALHFKFQRSKGVNDVVLFSKLLKLLLDA